MDTVNNMWELECINTITDKHILVSFFSTVQFSPKMIANKQPYVIFLYKLFLSNLDGLEIPGFEEMIQQLKDKYVHKRIEVLKNKKYERELVKNINAFLTDDMSKSLVISVINANLKTKTALEQMAATNKDLADSLYRLNVLYSTSSQFAGTLDKQKLVDYMIEGLDKSLSFDLTCTLAFCTENEPVLILNSLYEISEELLNAIKVRTVLNYKSLFEDIILFTTSICCFAI